MDSIFGGRIKVACLKFADYILNEPTNTPAHTSRVRWAQNTFQNPVMMATTVQPPVVMTGQVQADGAAVTDENLQVAVESVVGKIL